MTDAAPRPSSRPVVVLSGPSGSGKTTVARRLLDDPGWDRVVTATTRAPRGAERDGVDYRFLTDEAFREGLARGAFLEHAEVYGRLYGTPREEPGRILASGRVCLLVVDVQGARSLRALDFEGTYVFVDAPSVEELRRRLVSRGEDDPEVMAHRVAEAEAEREAMDLFDHLVVNREVDEAAREVAARAGLAWTPGGA